MNSLHKKRQALRQAIRSKTIQDIFRRKRQELLEKIKQNIQKEHNTLQSHSYHYNEPPNKFIHLTPNCFCPDSYTEMKQILISSDHQIHTKDQQRFLVAVTQSHNFKGLQKIDILSRLINRKEFSLDSEMQLQYGWKRLIQEFFNAIQQNQDLKRDTFSQMQSHHFFIKEKDHNPHSKIQAAGLKNMLCFSLIKIWQIKPKTQYFLIFTKAYHLFQQKISNSLSLTLIAELSYDRVLLPNPQFITKLLQVNIDKLTQVKFFRTLQILKNFIFHFKVDNGQIHARQLIFEYINWIKIQTNLLLSTYETNQSPNFPMNPSIHNSDTLMACDIESQTRYCLIYLIFTTMNKLFEVNQKEKEHLETKQILLLNEQMLNHSQNHTTLKFMIQEGKQATDPHHKNNILRTLTFFINFLEMSTLGNNHEQNNLGAEIEQIQKTFQGTELDWFQTFN